MRIVKSDTLTESQKKQIVIIWNAEYPVGLMYSSTQGFNDYLSKLDDLTHYLIEVDQTVIAWMSTFYRDNERWFAMMIDSTYQKQGLGKQLLQALKADHQEGYGWVVDHEEYLKVNGETYHSPLQFYLKNDFKLISDCRLELPQLSAVKISWRRPK